MNAEQYARQVHAEDRYGDEPYAVHLEAVVAVVREYDDSPEAEAVAWLHDVVEDSDRSVGDIERLFGREVSVPVACVSDPDGPNRRVKKARLHAQLAKLDAEQPVYRRALLVKLSDRLVNVRASVAASDKRRLKMYRREQEAFRSAVERAPLFAEMWAEIERLLAE